jgi:hypothetical protein
VYPYRPGSNNNRATVDSIEVRQSGARQPNTSKNLSVDNREFNGRLAFVG